MGPPLTQWIARLNDIGSATRPLAGRIEDEALRGERVRDQRAARGEIAGDRRLPRSAQPRQRHVRCVFARLGFNSDTPQAALLFGLQIHQRRLWLHLGHDRARLVAAKPAQSFEANGRRRPADVAEGLVDVPSGARVDVSNESQRHVIVLGLEPARADDSAAQERELTNDGVRQFEAGEQARHCRAYPRSLKMNWRKRSEVEPEKSSCGGPSASTSPWCRNITRVDTSRAKLISWVTTSIVRPSSASARITRSTSPTSSGSSAEVGSSNSITLGRMARARAIAARCC